MKVYFKEVSNITVEERIKNRNKIMQPLIKKYGDPVLTHFTNDLKSFKRILVDGKIKLPSQHNSKKKLPYTEKLLKIDNCIYYGIGFVYSTKYDFNYGFLFKLNYLQELTLYNTAIGRRVYKNFADYLYDNDMDYLLKLNKISGRCKKILGRYLTDEFMGKNRIFFDYWESEKEIYGWFSNYKNKKVISEIVNAVKKGRLVKYPQSLDHVREVWKTEKVPEIISRKSVSLLKSKYFLGFYISGNIPKDIQKVLVNKYKGKILFDGKKIKELK